MAQAAKMSTHYMLAMKCMVYISQNPDSVVASPICMWPLHIGSVHTFTHSLLCIYQQWWKNNSYTLFMRVTVCINDGHFLCHMQIWSTLLGIFINCPKLHTNCQVVPRIRSDVHACTLHFINLVIMPLPAKTRYFPDVVYWSLEQQHELQNL